VRLCEYTTKPPNATSQTSGSKRDLKEPTIYAAMLASFKHAVIVDNISPAARNPSKTWMS